MADANVKSFQFDSMERQWLRQSLATQRSVLVRKRNAELEGSEIAGLRTREIAAIDALVSKL